MVCSSLLWGGEQLESAIWICFKLYQVWVIKVCENYYSPATYPEVIICLSVSVSHSVMPDSLRPHGLQPTRLLCPWDFPGKDTGVGCHFLLQGIFPAEGLNPGLLHCRQILYRLRQPISMYQLHCNPPKRSVLTSPSLTHGSLNMILSIL